MVKRGSPYSKTTVAVAKSQEAIRQLLKKYGAKGCQFTEEFAADTITLRFVNQIKIGEIPLQVVVNMQLPKRGNEKQAFRALYWYLKTTLESIEFGIVKFEDAFLSYFEYQIPEKGTTTLGKELLPKFEGMIKRGEKLELLPREPKGAD